MGAAWTRDGWIRQFDRTGSIERLQILKYNRLDKLLFLSSLVPSGRRVFSNQRSNDIETRAHPL